MDVPDDEIVSECFHGAAEDITVDGLDHVFSANLFSPIRVFTYASHIPPKGCNHGIGVTPDGDKRLQAFF